MMIVNLSEESEKYINEQVQSGAFASAEELVEASLKLFHQEYAKWKAQKQKLTAMRQDLQLGLDDLRSGRSITLTSQAEVDASTEDIIRRGRERLQRKNDGGGSSESGRAR